jgi:hypothetical protein
MQQVHSHYQSASIPMLFSNQQTPCLIQGAAQWNYCKALQLAVSGCTMAEISMDNVPTAAPVVCLVLSLLLLQLSNLDLSE